VRVILVARTEATLRKSATEVKGSMAIACDLTDPKSVEQATKRITTELKGPPDILVNNAGIFSVNVVEETDAETFVATINTNLVAPFLFVRAFLADMKKRKSGHVVTIGSVADRTIYSGNAAYSAAKFGLRAMHEVLRAELRESGVKTSLISPAATNTDMWNSVTVTDPVSRPHSTRPMLEPEDVVRAVMFALTQPESVNVDELRLSHS
jgi:NADP-dependent 3-hydroxy acid dehydrogenase YdfG